MPTKETILIVEDEAGPRAALEMILNPIYNIHTVSNGKDALRIIQDQEVDLVTLDLKMPGLSGIDVLQEIKKIKPDAEVIIITGEGGLSNAKKTLQCGANDFISKPFHVAEVLNVVRKSFERRNTRLKINKLIQHTKDFQNAPANIEEVSIH